MNEWRVMSYLPCIQYFSCSCIQCSSVSSIPLLVYMHYCRHCSGNEMCIQCGLKYDLLKILLVAAQLPLKGSVCLFTAGVLLMTDLLAPTLNFLAELSRDTMMKDWLGQADNCAFWAVLLRALCANGSASVFVTSSSQMVLLFLHCYSVVYLNILKSMF